MAKKSGSVVGGAGAANLMEFWTMEVYDVGLLICLAVVVVGSIFGSDKGEGSFYQVAPLRIIFIASLKV